MAKRLENVLEHTISNDQTGFLRDRFIVENTRLVYDIMLYCEEHRIPRLFLLIDFEKAFTFGKMFREWLKPFLHNTEVCVQRNRPPIKLNFSITSATRSVN